MQNPFRPCSKTTTAMKPLILMISLCMPGAELLAQKVNSNDVPAAVRNSLDMNMHVKEAQWEMEGTNYEANFKKSGKEMSVIFDDKGVMLETEIEINRSDLPDMAKNILKTEDASYKVEEIEKVMTKGITTYEVEVEKMEKTFELSFDVQGRLLHQTEEKGEKAEKDHKH